MKKHGFAVGLMASVAASAAPEAEPYHLIPGRVPLDWQGPDGNTMIFDAPKGLVVMDTGRSPMHAKAILAYAKARKRPVAAIVNSHWHLDHTTGNADLRAVYPNAEVYATTAIEGALVGFLGRGRAQADKLLADPNLPEGQRAQILRGRDRIDHPDKLRPTAAEESDQRALDGRRRIDFGLGINRTEVGIAGRVVEVPVGIDDRLDR